MAICGISVEECPDGCWLKQQIHLAEGKLLRPAANSTTSHPDTFEGQVAIARSGIRKFERFECALEPKKIKARRECPSCPNLNQI